MSEQTPFELAFQNEIKEIEFFLGVAERARNPLVRSLFKTLAKEEMDLLGQVSELKQMSLKGGRWISRPFQAPVSSGGAGERDHNGSKSKPKTAECDADIDALRSSILIAQSGAQLFADLAKTAKDPDESRLYQRISRIESEHLLSLNDALYYLEDPESWLGDREHSSLDGA